MSVATEVSLYVSVQMAPSKWNFSCLKTGDDGLRTRPQDRGRPVSLVLICICVSLKNTVVVTIKTDNIIQNMFCCSNNLEILNFYEELIGKLKGK